MAKAEKAKAKRSHKPKTMDKDQSERFIEIARKLGVEETGNGFESNFRRVVSVKQIKQDQ